MNDDASRTHSADAPQDFLSATWRRLKDHRIAQWTVGYVAIAYGIQHGITLTADAFDWPHAVTRLSMLLLVLGLPLAMVFAWYHGERASRRVSAGELSILSVLLVIASLLFYEFVRPSGIASGPAIQEAGVIAARSAAADPRGGIAVAVLPFANLSDDKQQEYFSEGMTDEIGTALAKIPDLRLVARQSAFRFQNTKEDSRQIGQSLGATHLIEGSVYKSGNRVRITAELVKADSGLSIWSEKYDRDLTDLFAVQEDIARAIAASFHMTLGLKPGENLVNARTTNASSHDAYLKAIQLVRLRREKAIDQAIRILDGVIAGDPGYAPAWGLLGEAHHYFVLNYPAILEAAVDQARLIVQEHLPKGEAAAKRAIMLDARNSQGYLALAELREDAGDRLKAMDLYQQALALDPENPEALHAYSVTLADLGFVKKAIPIREHLIAIEPFVPIFQQITGRILFADGQNDSAITIFRAAQRPAPILAEIQAAQGKYREAADYLAALPTALAAVDPGLVRATEIAARLLRAAPASAPSNDRPELGLLDWVYVYSGAPERLLGPYEAGIRMGFEATGGTRGAEWAPAYASVRKTERFKKYVREAGMVAYWRAKGWPPQCHPTTGDDFECN